MNQFISLSFFHFKGIRNKFWAFKNMQLASEYFDNIPGLSFYKILGTGAGNGFRWYPDYTRYGILTVWNEKKDYQNYVNLKEDGFTKYKNRAFESFSVEMIPVKSQGKWSGKLPFISSETNEDGPIAVITRATIAPRHLISFWKTVRKVSKETIDATGRVFSVGIGEWPLIQQATFSIWKDMEAMQDFAYKSPHHKEVIRKTRQEGWFSEELFARFKVINLNGSWGGSKIDTPTALNRVTL